MTDEQLRELVASLLEFQRETDRQMKETALQMKETDRRMQETDRQMKETDRQIKEMGKQIGGLGDKFGSFTEGLALPSMTKILTQRFGMDVIAPRFQVRRNGQSLELDVLAYSHKSDDMFVVEVKSHLREEALEQIRKILRQVRDFLPEHQHRKIYGILAAVDAPESLRSKVLGEGIYLARIHDGEFELQVPDGFQPRAY